MKILTCLLITVFFNAISWAKEAEPEAHYNDYRRYNLRHYKKMGIGLSAAGALGLVGLKLEINFTPEYSLVSGFGGGLGYRSYTFQIKRTFGYRVFSPYVSVGFANWSSEKEKNVRRQQVPSFFSSKFLSSHEKVNGKFSKNIIYPGLGVQVMEVHGNWEGLTLYIEGLLLVDIEDAVYQPRGGLGLTYYF